MEEAAVGAEALADVKGGLTGYGTALVRFPDRGGAVVLIGNTNRVDDIRLGAGLGGGAGGGSVLTFDLHGLAGEVDIHFFGRDEPNLELYKRGVIGITGRAGLAREGDTVGRSDGIEELLVEGRRVLRAKRGIDHVVGEHLFPQADVGTAVFDIQIQLGRRRDLERDIIDRRKVRKRKPCQCRRDQYQHRDDAEQEGEFTLDSHLRFFQLQ